MEAAIEKSAMRKIYLRLLPFAVLSATSWPISTASTSASPALTMRGDLDMSAAAFGFAVGTFYWGYFIFEVPSNVIMEKVGARIWIARIMITWGIFAGADRLGHRLDQLRHRALPARRRRGRLLPGHRALFHLLVPGHHHARIVSGFLVGLPIAVAGGAPISTALLGLDGLFGLQGLADHVHRRGGSDDADRRPHATSC